jgi:hypothetical protein
MMAPFEPEMQVFSLTIDIEALSATNMLVFFGQLADANSP